VSGSSHLLRHVAAALLGAAVASSLLVAWACGAPESEVQALHAQIDKLSADLKEAQARDREDLAKYKAAEDQLNRMMSQPPPAAAAPVGPGCSRDTDCKGDRICANGQCRMPN
jgi:hypothetical protein